MKNFHCTLVVSVIQSSLALLSRSKEQNKMSKRLPMQRSLFGLPGSSEVPAPEGKLTRIRMHRKKKGYDVVDGRLISGREPNRSE